MRWLGILDDDGAASWLMSTEMGCSIQELSPTTSHLHVDFAENKH